VQLAQGGLDIAQAVGLGAVWGDARSGEGLDSKLVFRSANDVDGSDVPCKCPAT
jgi:hypothetical protein